MKKIPFVAVAFAMIFSSVVNGQEESQDIEVVGDPSGAIVIASSESTGDDGFQQSQMRVMTVDSADMASNFVISDFSSPFPSMMGGDNMAMLNNPSVQKDLQLVEEQLAQIREINKEFGKKITSAFKKEDGKFDLSNAQDIGSMIKDMKSQQQEQINEILLPHQQERLKQVSLQMKMKNQGTTNALTKALAEELGISDEQKKRIKKRSKELEKEVAKKMAEVRQEAKNELLNELTDSQRRKLEELIGDKFESKEEDFEGRRRFNFRSPKRKDF